MKNQLYKSKLYANVFNLKIFSGAYRINTVNGFAYFIKLDNQYSL